MWWGEFNRSAFRKITFQQLPGASSVMLAKAYLANYRLNAQLFL